MSFYHSSVFRGHICGLYYNVESYGRLKRVYLPQIELQAHATILATTSRTILTQTFPNPSTEKAIKEVRYTFPLFDGVSVVGFTCHVGHRTIVGEVKEKEKARAVFKEAVAKGQTAGLFEQLPEASDVFTTTVGNIPPGAKVVIKITYLGELKHDMEVDGIRFTIPTVICPRYGNYPGGLQPTLATDVTGSGISITVDAQMADGSFIQKMQSPTHPISMTMGTISSAPDAEPTMTKASASLTLGTAELDKDFIVQVIAKNTGIPKAILENHPTIPDHRALMATLVPKFALPPEKPELVFVCDRSGSMDGTRIKLAVQALKVFLKSLPVGVKFNICSFGSSYSFLWKKSATYGQETLDEAVRHAETITANYGGTEMLAPLKATIDQRYQDMPLDVFLLTDGEIWNQEALFSYLNESVTESKAPIRVFTLGIGNGVSHALIEGVAKAGDGFSQTVAEGEKMDTKVVRMLKGALSPHVNDYTLEVKYASATPEEADDDFEIVERVTDSLKIKLDLNKGEMNTDSKKPISLFDTSADPDKSDAPVHDDSGEHKYAHLPSIPVPNIIQAPQKIPSLFAFNRTTAYLLLGPNAPKATPKSVLLRGTSTHGPLELEIPIEVLNDSSETIHQLAAKKAISELEQGRGWLSQASDESDTLLKTKFEGRYSDMVEREAVRLGVQFQVGGKWCSFVAVESNERASEETRKEAETWEWLEDEHAAKQRGESTEKSPWIPYDSSSARQRRVVFMTESEEEEEEEELYSDEPGERLCAEEEESDSDDYAGASRFLRDTASDSETEDDVMVSIGSTRRPKLLAVSKKSGNDDIASDTSTPLQLSAISKRDSDDVEESFTESANIKYLRIDDPKLNVSSKDMGLPQKRSGGNSLLSGNLAQMSLRDNGSMNTTDENNTAEQAAAMQQQQQARQQAQQQQVQMMQAAPSPSSSIRPGSNKKLVDFFGVPGTSESLDTSSQPRRKRDIFGTQDFSSQSATTSQNPASWGGAFGQASGAFGASPVPPPPPAQQQQVQQQSQQQIQQLGGVHAQTSMPAALSSHAKQLADYQMGLMLLQQQNKKRRVMMSVDQDDSQILPPQPAPQFISFGSDAPAGMQPVADSAPDHGAFSVDSSAALENFDFDSFLSPEDTELAFDMDMEPGYSPASPISPAYSPASPVYSPTTPSGSPPKLDSSAPAALEAKETKVASMTDEELTHYLISLQSFEGSWESSTSLLEALQIKEKVLTDGASSANVDVKVFLTAVVVAVFEKKLQEYQGSWELVVDKAKTWLNEQGVDDVERLMALARILIK